MPGPTGLTTALQAHAHGARVRVVERRPALFRPSRALIVHPRTLEVLRPLGVVEALLARADTAPAVLLHLGRRVVPVRLGGLRLPDTAYPHLTLLRQLDVETALDRALAQRGVPVERGTELVGMEEDRSSGAWAVLRGPHGSERTWYRWVVGCDGTDSTVRRAAGIGWRGGGYRPEIVLADLELDGDLAPGVAHVVAGRSGLVFVFARGECATWRLLATRPCTTAAPVRPRRVPGSRTRATATPRRRGTAGPHPPGRLVEPGAGAAPARRCVPAGAPAPRRRRRALPLPRGRPGDEHRHPGRGEPGLEARLRPHEPRIPRD